MGSSEDEKVVKTGEAVKKIGRWVRSRSVREKVTVGAVTAIITLILLKLFVKTRTYFYVAAQTSHALAVFILLYKLTISKTCAGLSLKSQELTAIHLGLGILSSLGLQNFLHIGLDVLAFGATLWVIYMMRFKLKSTYMKELDNMPLYYVMVEPFTAHYMFALGVERFFGCANWIIQLIDTHGAHLFLIGQGHIWILLALLCELVQTFILADFCYYYFKSVMEGQSIMRLRLFV